MLLAQLHFSTTTFYSSAVFFFWQIGKTMKSWEKSNRASKRNGETIALRFSAEIAEQVAEKIAWAAETLEGRTRQ